MTRSASQRCLIGPRTGGGRRGSVELHPNDDAAGCPTGRAGPIVRGGRLARVERTTGPRGVLDRQPALFVAVRRQARCCSGSHRRVPPDDEVLFFATACDVDGSGRVVPMPQVGADFSAGQMNVDRPEWTAPSATARAFRSGAHVGWDPRVVSRSAAAAPARAHRSPCRRRRRTPAGSYERARARPGRTRDGRGSRDVRRIPAGGRLGGLGPIRRQYPRRAPRAGYRRTLPAIVQVPAGCSRRRPADPDHPSRTQQCA